ncbi:hypothetical protein QU42_19005 [Bradyrhizobium sp. UASWS1016]|jgi:hypothetical protein|nr:hypothetical protein CWS35_03640 [Bradyrhizobium sp. SK17]KIU46908.1 hypothetical protein QU41_21265 [Bradyrhizobium elkanii]OCX29752.1 hypothetical protein QU42_19005 [Bradyrhizobium sp. UASWS1016]
MLDMVNNRSGRGRSDSLHLSIPGSIQPLVTSGQPSGPSTTIVPAAAGAIAYGHEQFCAAVSTFVMAGLVPAIHVFLTR